MDTISYMLGYKKGLASAGSGKADSIYTVTFMSEDGETVLYLSDSISGCSGDMPAGHHPVIRMPADGSKMYLSSTIRRRSLDKDMAYRKFFKRICCWI